MTSNDDLRCPICIESLPHTRVQLPCGHSVCQECLKTYVDFQVRHGAGMVTCPRCDEVLPEPTLLSALDTELQEKYHSFSIRRALIEENMSHFHWCPGERCYYVVGQGSGTGICQPVRCENPRCEVSAFCFYCGLPYSGPSHECVVPDFNTTSLLQVSSGTTMRYQLCPTCNAPILKTTDTCNDMICILCSANFCFFCGKKVRGKSHYGIVGHGCPYFGDRPWQERELKRSRLALYLTTPLLIPLLILITLPVLVIVMPREIIGAVENNYQMDTDKWYKKHSKVILKVAGAMGGIILAPIIWSIGIVMGIPMMLVMVYIVLPLTTWKGEGA